MKRPLPTDNEEDTQPLNGSSDTDDTQAGTPPAGAGTFGPEDTQNWNAHMRPRSESQEVIDMASLNLESITFGPRFNRPMQNVILPYMLQSLTFGYSFNRYLDDSLAPIGRPLLPSSIQSLTFGYTYNQSLNNAVLPSSLRHLTFGHNFNQSVETVNWPSGLGT